MSEAVVLVDPGSGNLRSAAKAIARAAAERDLDVAVKIGSEPETVRRADRIVLPGQGAFGDVMAGIAAVAGLRAALEEAVFERGRPLLGICVGMQVLARTGEEHGARPGLGWLPGRVAPIARTPGRRIPHMGWNELQLTQPAHRVLRGVRPGDHAYFVHSFHMTEVEPGDLLADVDYDGPLTAMVGRGTVVGAQFHVEKSQAAGLAILGAFLEWRP